MIPFLCNKCNRNYCIRHRHEADHQCDTAKAQNVGENKDLNLKRLNFFQKQQEKPQNLRTTASNQSISSSGLRPDQSQLRQQLQPNAMVLMK